MAESCGRPFLTAEEVVGLLDSDGEDSQEDACYHHSWERWWALSQLWRGGCTCIWERGRRQDWNVSEWKIGHKNRVWFCTCMIHIHTGPPMKQSHWYREKPSTWQSTQIGMEIMFCNINCYFTTMDVTYIHTCTHKQTHTHMNIHIQHMHARTHKYVHMYTHAQPDTCIQLQHRFSGMVNRAEPCSSSSIHSVRWSDTAHSS